MIEEYIKIFCDGWAFEPYERRTAEIGGVTVESEVMIYSEGIHRRTKSHVIFKKSDKIYECDCVDLEIPFLSLITVEGKPCICFSKCLYGFTLLNVDSLEVEYEYFPEKVLNGEESFIITEAKNFGRLLILDGCYWACPYMVFAYDHNSRRFLPLSDRLGMMFDVNAVIDNQTLIVTGRDMNDAEISVTLTEQEVINMINESGISEP